MALVLLLLAVVLVPPEAASAARVSCAERGTVTVRENSVARVYRDGDAAYFSCSRRTGHREYIGDDAMGTVAEIRLRGHMLAHAFESCLDALGDECERGIALADVRAGRGLYSEAVPWDRIRIALRRTGAIAWAVEAGEGGEVYAWDRRRLRRVLDRSSGVDIGSLRLRGTTLSWVRGGTRRTATLR